MDDVTDLTLIGLRSSRGWYLSQEIDKQYVWSIRFSAMGFQKLGQSITKVSAQIRNTWLHRTEHITNNLTVTILSGISMHLGHSIACGWIDKTFFVIRNWRSWFDQELLRKSDYVRGIAEEEHSVSSLHTALQPGRVTLQSVMKVK